MTQSPEIFTIKNRWSGDAQFSCELSAETPDKNPAAKLAVEWVDEAIAIRDNIRASVVVAA
jgi:lipopolysaccharide biosynthesis regulator YciM